jgi:hypothetical protein
MPVSEVVTLLAHANNSATSFVGVSQVGCPGAETPAKVSSQQGKNKITESKVGGIRLGEA